MPTIEEIKTSVPAHLQGPLEDWIDEMLTTKADAKMAYTSLALFFGHMLAGVACELDVETPDLPSTVSGLIRDTMAKELAAPGVQNET